MKKLVWIVLLVCATAVFAEVTQKQRDEAAKFYQEQNWKKAAEGYKKISKTEPTNANSRFRWAASLHNLGKYKEAAAVYEEVVKLGTFPPLANYNLACSYAKAGETEKAKAALEKAYEVGFSDLSQLDSDSDLVSIRSQKNFPELKEKIQKLAMPCEYNLTYRQFDFWVGNWDVYGATGIKAGTSVIEKTEKGCVIVEKWQGRFNTGMSINYFDPAVKKWKEDWVDDHSGTIHYVGEFKDGKMLMEGESTDIKQVKSLSRMTFFPQENGHVRQLIESSKDGGATWVQDFDGDYRPAGK